MGMTEEEMGMTGRDKMGRINPNPTFQNTKKRGQATFFKKATKR